MDTQGNSLQDLINRNSASGTTNQVNPFIPTARFDDSGSTNPFFVDELKRTDEFELTRQIRKGQAGVQFDGNYDNYKWYQDRPTDENALGNLGLEYLQKYKESKGWGEQNTYGRDAWLRFMKGESSNYFWNPQNLDDPSNVHNKTSYLSAMTEGIGKWFYEQDEDVEYQKMKDAINTKDSGFTEAVRIKETDDFLSANKGVARVLTAGGIDLHDYTRGTNNKFGHRFSINNAVIDALQNIRLQKWDENNQMFGSQMIDRLAYGLQDPLMARDIVATTALTLGLGTIEAGAATLARGVGQTTLVGARAMSVARGASGLLQLTSPFTGLVEGPVYKALQTINTNVGRGAAQTVMARMLAIGTEAGLASGKAIYNDQRNEYDWKNLVFQNNRNEFRPDWMQVGIGAATGFGTGGAALGLMRFGLGAIGDVKYIKRGDWAGYGKAVVSSLDTWARTTDGLTVFGETLSGGRGVLFGDLMDRYMNKVTDTRDYASVLVNGTRLFSTAVFSPEVAAKANFDEKAATSIAVEFEKATKLPGEVVQQYPSTHPVRLAFDNLMDPDYLSRTGTSYNDMAKLISTFNERKAGFLGPIDTTQVSVGTARAIEQLESMNSIQALMEIADVDRILRIVHRNGSSFDEMSKLHKSVTGNDIDFGRKIDRDNFRLLAHYEANGKRLANRSLETLNWANSAEPLKDLLLPDGKTIKGEVMRDTLRTSLGLDSVVEVDGVKKLDTRTSRIFITDSEDGSSPSFVISVEPDGTITRHSTTLNKDSQGRITIDSEITKAADYKPENIRSISDMQKAYDDIATAVKRASDEIDNEIKAAKKTKLEKIAKTSDSVAEALKDMGKLPTRKVLSKHFNLSTEEAAMAQIVMDTLGMDIEGTVIKIAEARGSKAEKMSKIGAKASIQWEAVESGIHALIRTTRHSDFGSLVHEMGHYNRMLMIGDSADHKAYRNKIGISDELWDKFTDWVGYKGEWELDVAKMSKEQRIAEEKFANAWAFYIRSIMKGDGKTNATGLHRLFSALGDHLGDLGKKMESQTELEKGLDMTDVAKEVYTKLFLRSEPRLTKFWQLAEKNVFKSLDAESRAKLGEHILGTELWNAHKASIQAERNKAKAKIGSVMAPKPKTISSTDIAKSIHAKVTGAAFNPTKKSIKLALNEKIPVDKIEARIAELRTALNDPASMPASPLRLNGDPKYFASHVADLSNDQLKALPEGTILKPISGVVSWVFDEKAKQLDVSFPVMKVTKELIDKELLRRSQRDAALARLKNATKKLDDAKAKSTEIRADIEKKTAEVVASTTPVARTAEGDIKAAFTAMGGAVSSATAEDTAKRLNKVLAGEMTFDEFVTDSGIKPDGVTASNSRIVLDKAKELKLSSIDGAAYLRLLEEGKTTSVADRLAARFNELNAVQNKFTAGEPSEYVAYSSLRKPVLPDFSSETPVQNRFTAMGEADSVDPEILKLIDELRVEREAELQKIKEETETELAKAIEAERIATNEILEARRTVDDTEPAEPEIKLDQEPEEAIADIKETTDEAFVDNDGRPVPQLTVQEKLHTEAVDSVIQVVEERQAEVVETVIRAADPDVPVENIAVPRTRKPRKPKVNVQQSISSSVDERLAVAAEITEGLRQQSEAVAELLTPEARQLADDLVNVAVARPVPVKDLLISLLSDPTFADISPDMIRIIEQYIDIRIRYSMADDVLVNSGLLTEADRSAFRAIPIATRTALEASDEVDRLLLTRTDPRLRGIDFSIKDHGNADKAFYGELEIYSSLRKKVMSRFGVDEATVDTYLSYKSKVLNGVLEYENKKDNEIIVKHRKAKEEYDAITDKLSTDPENAELKERAKALSRDVGYHDAAVERVRSRTLYGTSIAANTKKENYITRAYNEIMEEGKVYAPKVLVKPAIETADARAMAVGISGSSRNVASIHDVFSLGNESNQFANLPILRSFRDQTGSNTIKQRALILTNELINNGGKALIGNPKYLEAPELWMIEAFDSPTKTLAKASENGFKTANDNVFAYNAMLSYLRNEQKGIVELFPSEFKEYARTITDKNPSGNVMMYIEAVLKLNERSKTSTLGAVASDIKLTDRRLAYLLMVDEKFTKRFGGIRISDVLARVYRSDGGVRGWLVKHLDLNANTPIEKVHEAVIEWSGDPSGKRRLIGSAHIIAERVENDMDNTARMKNVMSGEAADEEKASVFDLAEEDKRVVREDASNISFIQKLQALFYEFLKSKKMKEDNINLGEYFVARLKGSESVNSHKATIELLKDIAGQEMSERQILYRDTKLGDLVDEFFMDVMEDPIIPQNLKDSVSIFKSERFGIGRKKEQGEAGARKAKSTNELNQSALELEIGTELRDGIYSENIKTTKDLLESLGRTESEYAGIARQLIVSSNRELDKIAVYPYKTRENLQAAYNSKIMAIIFNADSGDATTGRFVVHEALHAITSRALAELEYNITSGTGKTYIKGLRDFVASNKTKEYVAEIELVESYLEALDSGMFKTDIDAINDPKKYVGNLDLDYGMMDIHEFVSEAMSNPKFASRLKDIPTTTKADRSILNKLLDAVASWLGITNKKDASLLEKLVLAVDDIAKKEQFDDDEWIRIFTRANGELETLDPTAANRIQKAFEDESNFMRMLGLEDKARNDLSAAKGRLFKQLEDDELYQSAEFFNSEFERGLIAERYIHRRFQSDQLSQIHRGGVESPDLKEFLHDWGKSLLKVLTVEDEKVVPPVLKKLSSGQYEYGSDALVFENGKATMKRLLFNRFGNFLDHLAELSPEDRSRQAGEMLDFIRSDETITAPDLQKYGIEHQLYQSATPGLIDAVDLRRRKLAELGLNEELTTEDIAAIQRIMHGLSPVDVMQDNIFSNIKTTMELSPRIAAAAKTHAGKQYRKMTTDERRDFIANTVMTKIQEAMGDRNSTAGVYSAASDTWFGKKVNSLIGGAVRYGDTADSNSIFLQFVSKIFDPMMDLRNGELKNKWNMPSVDKLNAEVNNLLLRSGLIQMQEKVTTRIKDRAELERINNTAWLYLTKPETVPDGPNKDLILGVIKARNEFNRISVELLSNYGDLSKKTDPMKYGTSHIVNDYAKNNQKQFVDALVAHAVRKTMDSNEISVITAEALGWVDLRRDAKTDEIVSITIKEDSPLAGLVDEKTVGKKQDWNGDMRKLFSDVTQLSAEAQEIHRNALFVNDDYTDSWKQGYAAKGNEFTAMRQSMEIAKNRYLGISFDDSKSANPRRMSLGEGRNYTEERILTHDEIASDENLRKFFSTDIINLTHQELRGHITDAMMTKYLTDFFGVRLSMSDLLQILATTTEEFNGRSHLSLKEIESRKRGYERLRDSWDHSIGNMVAARDSVDRHYETMLNNARPIVVGASGLRAALLSIPETARAVLTSNKHKAKITQVVPNLVKLMRMVGPGGKKRRLARAQMISASHWLRGLATDHMLHRHGIHPENPFQGVVFGQGAGGMVGNFINTWRLAGQKNKTETSMLGKFMNRSSAFAAAAEAPLAFVNDCTTMLHIWNAQENLTTNVDSFKKMATILNKNPAANYSEFADLAKKCGLLPKEALDLNTTGLLDLKYIEILEKAAKDQSLYTDGMLDVRKMYLWAGEDVERIEAISRMGSYINMTARHTNVEPTLLDIRVNNSLFGRAYATFMQFLLSIGIQEIGRRRRTPTSGYSEHLAGLLLMDIVASGTARALSNPEDDNMGGVDEFEKNPMDYLVKTATSMPLLGSYSWLGTVMRHAIMGTSEFLGGPKAEQDFRIPDLIGGPISTSPRRLLNTPETIKGWYNSGHKILDELLSD